MQPFVFATVVTSALALIGCRSHPSAEAEKARRGGDTGQLRWPVIDGDVAYYLREETLPKGASPTKVTQWLSTIRAQPLTGGVARTVVGDLDHAGPLVAAGPGKLLVAAGPGDARTLRLIDTTTGSVRVLGRGGSFLNDSEIASDGVTAHWVASSSTLYSAPLAGGDPIAVSMTGYLTAVALSGTTRFVHDSTRKKITAVDSAGDTLDVGSTEKCRFVSAIAVDADSIFWGCPSNGEIENGSIERVARSGGPTTELVSGVAEVGTLVNAGRYLVAVEFAEGRRLMRIDKQSGASVELARPSQPTQLLAAGVDVAKGAVYYLTNTLTSAGYGEGHLAKVPLL